MTDFNFPGNIGELLENAAARFGDKKFFIIDHEGLSFSFSEMNRKVNQYANALQKAGIGAGTHVSVMLPNCSEFPLTWLALARLGAVMVPVNNRYQVRDLEYILDDSDSTFFILHPDYLPIYDQVTPGSNRLGQVFLIGAKDETLGPSLPELAAGMNTDFSHSGTQPGLDSVMNLQYTSGTTGFPKAAITTHAPARQKRFRRPPP